MQAPAERPLFSMLNRERALSLTCSALAAAIRGDGELPAMILEAALRQNERDAAADPSRRPALDRQEKQKVGAIDLLMEQPGDDPEERRDTRERLARYRRELAEIRRERSHFEATGRGPLPTPTDSDVRAWLGGLGSRLEPATDAGPEAAARLREVLGILTGGRIDLRQCGKPTAHAGWLEGRFTLCHVRLAAHLLGRPPGEPAASSGEEIVIAYRDPTPAERHADAAKALYDDGLEIKAIAARLGITYNLARRALLAWSTRTGTPLPDGRARQARLPQPDAPQPPMRALAGEIKRLYDERLTLRQIAAQVRHSVPLVRRSLELWFRDRGLARPDGRARRKELPRRPGSRRAA
ncbi:hypothetical protein EP7_005585 (plasmid) [Isosphaeraceae bacterium EP7]